MKAIVIGATGLIGGSLVQQLAGAENVVSVIAINRREIKYSHPKIENIVVEYDKLDAYSEAFSGDVLFSCLGTTLKIAGSVEAQRKVDVDYQLFAATLASKQGVGHYFLVSSSGANAKSGNAYLKMKGELEEQVKELPFKSLSIFQPSLLLGERNHLRIGEKLASYVMPVIGIIPLLRKYRPIQGEQVARKMVEVNSQLNSGVKYYSLDEIF